MKYLYFKCDRCGSTFRVIASARYGTCPACGWILCTRISKKEYLKSKEVKPDDKTLSR